MVLDFIDNDGKFSSWQKVLQKFNLSPVNFLLRFRILHPILREWNNIINENTFRSETLDQTSTV